MKVIAVNKHRFIPKAFEICVGIKQFSDDRLFDVIDSDIVSCFSIAFRIFFECKVITINDASNTPYQMEFIFILISEGLSN